MYERACQRCTPCIPLVTVPIKEAQSCPVQGWGALGGGRGGQRGPVLFGSEGHVAVLLFLEFGEFFFFYYGKAKYSAK